MDETEIKHVVEAALLAAGRPLTLDRLAELFAAKGGAPERPVLKRVLETLATDYRDRGIELREVASGYRVQVKGSMTDWLQPLWEERAPRYTRALLETLALVAYRQPITRAEIEEVRGVVVSTNIVRTLLERNWIRVVGHRDVPGKPAMFGTTKEFLDYFGLKKLEDLPTLADVKDGFPELSPQTDMLETLEAGAAEEVLVAGAHTEDAPADEHARPSASTTIGDLAFDDADVADDGDDSELDGPDLTADDDNAGVRDSVAASEGDEGGEAADVVPLRAAGHRPEDAD